MFYVYIVNELIIKRAVIVFVVSSDERNIGDQRLLEYKCMETRRELLVRRYTFADIYQKGELNENKKLIVYVCFFFKLISIESN